MVKIYLAFFLVLILATSSSACLGISPSPKNIKVIANQQSTTSFMFSNGCDVPIVVELSANMAYVTPEVSRIVIQPKKDLAVTFIIHPLSIGEYNAQINGKILGTTNGGTGMGMTTEIGANIRITAGTEQSETQKPLDTTITCGDGKCYFSEYDTCPADCPKIDSGGIDYKIIVGIVGSIIVAVCAGIWWKRNHY